MIFIRVYILHILFNTALSVCDKSICGRFLGDLIDKNVHKVGGEVYAVDEFTFYIKGFSYDGMGPGAHFRVGNNDLPDKDGLFVPYPQGYTEMEPLEKFQPPRDIVLRLPTGVKIKDNKWLYVWCKIAGALFGQLEIPSSLVYPKVKELTEFSKGGHGVGSGKIKILDARTILIPKLSYDGAAPDVFFLVGVGTGSSPNAGGKKIPDENGDKDNKIKSYDGTKDITLRLPASLTVYEISWISIYCVSYKENFGHVIIPKGLDVPPDVQRSIMIPNCNNFLEGSVQLQWETKDDMAKFTLSGRITDKQWVAVGISPELGKAVMIGGDAVVVYMTQGKKFHADDYYMSAKSQCNGQEGACPDSRIGKRNNVVMVGGTRNNGVTKVIFRRPIKANETKYDLSLEGTVTMYVAMGNLNANSEVAYHYEKRTKDNFQIDVTAASKFECRANLDDSFVPAVPKVRVWPPILIEGVQEFTARIGLTGADRGYTPITGNPSWGIAWYINDMLIPEIYVERGKTYTFLVEGGHDETNDGRNHPFYITSDSQGGFIQKSLDNQNEQKVFAGVDKNATGYHATAAGRYCGWVAKTVDESRVSETFEAYAKTLKLECEPDKSDPVKLSWTVAKETPDTVYYQCYTHNHLGWKIHVKDPGFKLKRSAGNSVLLGTKTLLLIVLGIVITSYNNII